MFYNIFSLKRAEKIERDRVKYFSNSFLRFPKLICDFLAFFNFYM